MSDIATYDSACHCTYEVDKASMFSRLSNLESSLTALDERLTTIENTSSSGSTKDDTTWKSLIAEIKEVILPALETRLKLYSNTNRDSLIVGINQISSNLTNLVNSLSTLDSESTNLSVDAVTITAATSGAGATVTQDTQTVASPLRELYRQQSSIAKASDIANRQTFYIYPPPPNAR